MNTKQPRLDKDGFPIPAGFDDAPGGTAATGDRGRGVRRLARWAVVIVVFVGLWIHFDGASRVKNLVATQLYREALRQTGRNDLTGALATIDRAIGWSPERAEFFDFRWRIKAELKDWEGALADIRKAAELKPDEVRYRDVERGILHRLGRHRETAALATDMLAKSQGSRATLLNDRAYARALGEFDLSAALVDSEEALRLTGGDDASLIDTRGYVLLKLGKAQEALADFERALKLVEQEVEESEQVVRGRKLEGRIGREVEGTMQRLKESQAVMHQHRGEAHDKLGNDAAARKDFVIARELGFDPANGVY